MILNLAIKTAELNRELLSKVCPMIGYVLFVVNITIGMSMLLLT